LMRSFQIASARLIFFLWFTLFRLDDFLLVNVW
jgi:hypothetical protein